MKIRINIRLGKAEVGGSIPLGSLNNYNKEIPQKWLKIAVSVVFFYIFINFISKQIIRQFPICHSKVEVGCGNSCGKIFMAMLSLVQEVIRMAKRMNGEGTWGKKTINGHTYYVFKKTYPEKRKEFTGKTKKEVDEKVRAYEEKRKTLVESSPITLGEYILEYTTTTGSKNLGKTAKNNYEDIVRTRVLPKKFGISDLQLSQVTKSHMKNYVDKLIESKYARSTIVKTMRIVRKAIEAAIKNKEISPDVLEEFIAPSENAVLTEKRKIPFLCKKDMAAVFEEAKKPKYAQNGYALILIMYTGIRAGELQELRWSDVDYKNNTLSIKRTAIKVKNDDGKNIIVPKNSPKSKAGIRVIPLCKQSIFALKAFETFNPKHKPDDFVCLNNSGKQIDQSNLRRTLLCVLKNSSCSVKHCGLHALRHSFGSRLLEEGVDIKVVSLLLGHEKISTTYDIYIHILNKRITSSIKVFDEDDIVTTM